MASRTDTAWRLLEAAEILHAHTDGSFGSRLATSTRKLFHGSVYALDVFMPDGRHIVENNIPFDRRVTEIIHAHGAEIILRDHPTGSKLLDRRITLGRLSDFTSRRSFEETELFKTIYGPGGLNFQMFATLPLPVGRGAFSVDRDAVDFSDEEVRLLGHFARHIERAYATELRLRERSACEEATELELRERLLVRGLTNRESGVMFWLGRGKRSSEIAIILGISRRTVEVHLANSYRKLGVDNRAAALLVLREVGL